MPNENQPPDAETDADQLAKLAEMLCLEVAEDDLEALSNQLRLIEELDKTELRDVPPILRMDADWHD